MLRATLMAVVVSLVAAGPVLATEPEGHEVTVPSAPGESVIVEWTGVSPAGAKITGECPQDATSDIHTITMAVPAGTYEGVEVAAKVVISWQDDFADVGVPPLQDLILTVWHDDDVVIYRDVMENWREGDSRIEVVLTDPGAGTYLIAVCAGESHVDTPFDGSLVMAAGEAPAGDPGDAGTGSTTTDPDPTTAPELSSADGALPTSGGGGAWGAVVLLALAARRRPRVVSDPAGTVPDRAP